MQRIAIRRRETSNKSGQGVCSAGQGWIVYLVYLVYSVCLVGQIGTPIWRIKKTREAK